MTRHLKHQPWLKMLVLLSLSLLALTGCSSDEDPTTPGGGSSDAPAFLLGGEQAVNLPAVILNSNDPNAQAIVGVMHQVNVLSGMQGFLAIPDDAVRSQNKDNTWTYTWSLSEGQASLTIVMVVQETADSYIWTLSFNGTDGEDTFENFVIYRAEQAMDASWGTFDFYELGGDPEDVVFHWDWGTDSLGVFSITMIGGAGEGSAKIEFVIQPTDSGSLDVYEMVGDDWQLVLHYDWNGLGSGTYAIYEDGVLVDSGLWGVPL